MPDTTAAGKRPPLPEPLPRPVIDSHCHIDMRGGDEDELSPADAVAAAMSVNVTGIVQVGCSIRDVHAAVAMAEQNPAIVAAIGIHPNEAPRLAAKGELDAAIATVEQLALGSPRVRGIGETGLDFFRTRDPEAWVIQEQSFRAHIDIARRLGRALVIHDRDSHDDVIRVLLDELAVPGCPTSWCSTASPATSRWPGSPPSTGGTSPSPGPSRSPMPVTCTRPRRSCRATGSSSRPTRRS